MKPATDVAEGRNTDAMSLGSACRRIASDTTQKANCVGGQRSEW